MINSKRFVRRVFPRAGVTIAAGATGFIVTTAATASPFIGSIAGAAAGFTAGKATEKLLHWTLGQTSDIYREAEGTIFDKELGGRDKLDYYSVSHFWNRIEPDLAEILGKPRLKRKQVPDFWSFVGMSEREKRKFGMPITVTGLLTPYGPLTPAHPMSRPGYSVGGWENMGELETEDTEAYDIRDAIIYGDRVLRLSRPNRGIYYGGIYDAEFGIANVGIPLYISASSLKGKSKGDLYKLWEEELSLGVWARIRGNLIAISNFYSVVEQVPSRFRNLPSFGIEVTEIERWQAPEGHTHISASVGWERSHQERMITHYFNVQDASEFKHAESLLQRKREEQKKVLQFDYDNEKYLSGRWKRDLPIYNQMLDYWLSK